MASTSNLSANVVPEDEEGQPMAFTVHTESSARILLPSPSTRSDSTATATNGGKEAFLNPVQEFNRDLSVACIAVWGAEMNREKEARWRRARERRLEGAKGREKKRTKTDSGAVLPGALGGSSQSEETSTVQKEQEKLQPEYRPYKFVILEALSATGLRAIRYAKEIPLVNYVIANDLSPSAVEAMNRNVEFNGLGPVAEMPPAEEASNHHVGEVSQPNPSLAKVRVNKGDACALMYSHRTENARVDVVDLDPYGTAAPFIDAAVQCVNDGGLLCVTCTDLAVLATNNYPEKCFANYGGIPLKAEYCHEGALRLVLHAISTSAGRYGRYIQPLLSLSIDFYVRLFVRVQSGPMEVKKAVTKVSTYYVCVGCQSFYEQPLSRVVEKVHEPSGNVNLLFKTHQGPTAAQRCSECDSPLHVAGPMWSGPLHDVEFVGKVLEHLGGNEKAYGTSTRMRGMLTVAKEELQVPFFFTPSKLASFFHCVSPSLDELASALLHAGHQVSRSHVAAGSLKTTAIREEIHDVYRSWVKLHPVKMDKVGQGSPARRLLEKEPMSVANFSRHPKSVTASSQVKLVRYQQNPTSYWGPGSRAVGGGKRKRNKGE